MNSAPSNWSHLQSFIAVVETGSFSAAARAVRASQPTLSRHIALLEEQMGQRLFLREAKGLVLTAEGTALMEAVAPMADAAARASLLQGTETARLSGTVRITASRMVATYLLPPLLVALNQQAPGIALEVVGSDDTSNLLRREADIALRMYRPTQNDVITRHLGDLPVAAYATPAYLARHGTPQTAQDLQDHRVIGYDRSTLIIDGMLAYGMEVGRDFFAFRSDDQVLCWEMVRAGFGIGFNQTVIGDADPGVVPLIRDLRGATLPVWLTAHPEMRQVPRIRWVYDALAKAFIAHVKRAATRSPEQEKGGSSGPALS